MSLPVALRALRYYNFRLYFTGQAISLVGTWMQRVAISWLVYTVTHSALMLGIVGFAGQIPVMLLSPYAGAFTDRHSRYRILLRTQIASMMQAGLLTVMIMRGFYNMTAIITLSVILGIINAFDTPARQSLMIRLIDDKNDLPNAIALNSSMVTLARLLGPVAAGILLSSFGESICFLINFLSFIAVIVSLLLMKLKIPERKKQKENIWAGLKEGYNYLKEHRGIRLAILLMALTSFIVMPYSTLLPVYAQTVFKGNVTTYSWLNSISGFGALIGAIFITTSKSSSDLPKLITYSCLLMSVSLALFSFTTSLPLALFFIMIGESGMLVQIASTNTYIQTHVDENMRGRVISYYVMAFQGMQPIGSFFIGLSAHKISAPHTVLFEGLAGVVVAFFFISLIRKRAAVVVN